MKKEFTNSMVKFIKVAIFILFFIFNFSHAKAQCYTGPNYCIATTTNVNSYSIGLQNVTFGSAINNSTSATGNSPNYFDFTNLAVSGIPGTVINFSIQNGGGNSTSARIFIDWDQDGSFTTSATELVWTSATTTAGATVSDTFSIPSGQAAGLYRIRVTGDFGGSASGNPCKLNYGETEDYSLIVTSSSKDGIAKSHISPSAFSIGSDTIRFSLVNLLDTIMTSVDIGYQLDNNTPVIQSLSSLTVPEGSIYTATFDTLLNLTTAGTYSLKVWLNNVNGGGTITPANDTICRSFILCTSPLNGSYTIDPNGSGSSNFVSFTEVATALANCGISGPVVFNISADSFYEQVSIPSVSGSSPTNTIDFIGSGMYNTTLCYSGVSSDPHTMRLDGSKYINFRDMAIKSSSSSDGWVLNFLNAGNSNVSHCLIEFVGAAQTSNKSNLACIVFNGSNITMSGQSTKIDSINIDTCIINYGYDNVYMYLGGNNQNAILQFRGDSFTNAYYSSIYIWLNARLCHKIINNRFSLRSGVSNQFAIWSWASAASNSSLFSEISNNKFTSLNGYGIATTYAGGSGGARGQIYNNVFGPGARGVTKYISGAGAACCAFDGWNIFHNTIYMDYNSGVSVGVDFGGNTSGTNVSIKNNIFYNASTSANNIAIGASNSGAIGGVDYNDYYTNYAGGNLATITGSNFTASNYLGTYPNGLGLNSLNRNVSFFSGSDFHHTTACMSGETGLGVTYDFDGVSRTTPPDLGAYEVSGVPPVDAGVSQIVTPVYPVSAGSQSLSALVKNYGSDSISSLTVYYTINNSAIDSQTFTFSPALFKCDTATVTFTNSITIGSGTNTIKVFSAYPNDTFLTNDTAQNTFCVAMAGSYTINSNNSASATNFTNFNAAITQLNCSGMSGSVVFDVSADTYTEQVEIGIIKGLSSTNTLSFIGHGTDSTLLTYSGSSTAPHTLRLSSANDVTFRDMNIQATNGNYAWAVHLMNSRHNKFGKCKIECSGSAASSAAGSIAAVVLNGNTTSINTQGANDDNYIDSNVIIGGYYGILCDNNVAKYVNYIRNNNISNSYYSGLYAYGNQALKVLNNKIENRASNSNNSSGIYFYFVFSSTSGIYNEIKGNYINNVGQYGIYIQYSQGGVNATRGEMYNNMIGGNYTSSSTVYGIHMYYAPYWNVYHNTVSVASKSGSSHRALYLNSYVYRSQFINNSFAITNANASSSIVVEVATGTTLPDSLNYNNYYNAADTSLLLLGTQYYNSTNFQVAYPNGGGAQSFEGDPQYNSASDLHATGTQLDNRGNALGLSVDIDDDTRNNTTPDIGADEFSAITTKDFSLNKLLSPVAAGCLGGYNQTITVSIKNTGIDTIDLTNDTAWVAAEVTDPNSNILTYGPVAVTGKTFYPKDAMTVDVTNKFDMSDIGTYYIRPYVSYKKDTNGFNDTLQNLSFDETNPVPILSFIPSTSICSNDSIKMSAVDSKNTSDFQWYYNGSPVNGATDSVFYATQAGEYYCNVADNYYSGCDVNSDTITVKVGSAPSASFTVGKITFCSGDSSMLTAKGGSANNYQWLFNNTVIQGANDSIYYATASGNYSVVVQDKTSACAALSSSSKLTVYASPNASISYVGNGIKCMGDSLKLSSLPGSGLTYQWLLNGKAINAATDSMYYASATGDYQVEILNTNGCKATSAVSRILVDSLPSSLVNIKGNPTACGLDTVFLDVVNNANYTYAWMDNGNAISGATTNAVTVYTNGSYTVKVTNANGCSSTSSAVNVAYKLIPTIPVLNGNNTSMVCPGDSMRISVSAQDTGSFTYQWKLNGTNIGSGTDSFLYISTTGTYTAEVINNGGCSSTSTTNITLSLYTAPTPALTATGSTTLCIGDSVGLTASNATTGITSLSWMLNTTVLSSTANPIYVKASGPYTAKVTDNNGCKATTAPTNVFVNPLPVAVITQDIPNNELSTTTFVAYQWYKNGVAISGATSQKLKVYSNGNYTVEVTDANGCKGMSAASTVTWGGIAKAATTTIVNVYPNPSHDLFNIELPVGSDMKQIYLTDIAGRQVVISTYQVNKNIYTIDLSDKAAGIYIIHLTKGDEVLQTRLIKY